MTTPRSTQSVRIGLGVGLGLGLGLGLTLGNAQCAPVSIILVQPIGKKIFRSKKKGGEMDCKLGVDSFRFFFFFKFYLKTPFTGVPGTYQERSFIAIKPGVLTAKDKSN